MLWFTIAEIMNMMDGIVNFGRNSIKRVEEITIEH